MPYCRLILAALAIIVLAAVLPPTADAQQPAPSPISACQPRLGLGNFFAKLKAGSPVSVAYFGGSITAAAGWRVKTLAWLRKSYPNVDFTEINAAIGGTGSDLGAYRFQQDVLSHNPALIFVEFAVNDGSTPQPAILRQMEGIVRQARKSNPAVDICFIYTFRTGYEEWLSKAENPPAAVADEQIAQYYGIPSINLAPEIVREAEAGKLIYLPSKDSAGAALPTPDGVTLFSEDGVHPTDAGHDIYAGIIESAFDQMASIPPVGNYPKHPPLVADNWEEAKQAPITASMLSSGWTKLSTTEGIGKNFNARMPEIWQATQPGETISFKFKGTRAALYDIMGPDAGEAIVTLDGKTTGTISRFDKYCTYYRLAMIPIASDLPDTVHSVSVAISPVQPDRTPAISQEKATYDPKKYDGTVLRIGSIMLIGDIVN